ncbi:MAG: hypothetical protein CL927_20010 [Deltaproteobacteria bacterium]|nr:hypothetical protein [Deltaproteobacteria bacterium]HCH61900.1 hypothetical protein [Deltaproteobacteria bacterium]
MSGPAWSVKAVASVMEDQLSSAALAAGASGNAAVPACRRMAPELLLCVQSPYAPGRVAMMAEVVAAGQSLDGAFATARDQVEAAWARVPARTFSVDGIAGQYYVRSGGDGFDAAALLRPELLARLAGGVPVVAVPEDGTVVWWVPGHADFDKMVAVGVRRMAEASSAPVSSRIYQHTGTKWSTWAEVRGNIGLPAPVPQPPPSSEDP